MPGHRPLSYGTTCLLRAVPEEQESVLLAKRSQAPPQPGPEEPQVRAGQDPLGLSSDQQR